MRLNSENNSAVQFETRNEVFIDEISSFYFSLEWNSGFIQHPPNIPITAKISQTKANVFKTASTGIGISFYSNELFLLNQVLEISIFAQEKEHSFCGEVVMLNHEEEKSLIGIWVNGMNEVRRLRTLEQFCHLETFIHHNYSNIDVYNDKKCSELLHTLFPSI